MSIDIFSFRSSRRDCTLSISYENDPDCNNPEDEESFILPKDKIEDQKDEIVAILRKFVSQILTEELILSRELSVVLFVILLEKLYTQVAEIIGGEEQIFLVPSKELIFKNKVIDIHHFDSGNGRIISILRIIENGKTTHLFTGKEVASFLSEEKLKNFLSLIFL